MDYLKGNQVHHTPSFSFMDQQPLDYAQRAKRPNSKSRKIQNEDLKSLLNSEMKKSEKRFEVPPIQLPLKDQYRYEGQLQDFKLIDCPRNISVVTDILRAAFMQKNPNQDMHHLLPKECKFIKCPDQLDLLARYQDLPDND